MTKSAESLDYQKAIVDRFLTIESNGRLAHAYLFVGQKGSGKGQTALAIVKTLNCEKKGKVFCGKCPTCVKINTANHPDVIVIDNEDQEAIKIHQIREILNQSKLKPFLMPMKVFIINNIDRMTVEAANAFLKTLEEPQSNRLLLLTTSALEKNLDTIKSRCHIVQFEAPSSNRIKKYLQNENNLGAEDAHYIANYAQGSIGQAHALAHNGFLERKNDYIESFILKRPSDNDIKDLLADKHATREFTDVLLSWIRDVLLMKAGCEDSLIMHADRLKELKEFSQRFTFEDLAQLNQSALKMVKLIVDNLNVKLSLHILGEQLWEK